MLESRSSIDCVSSFSVANRTSLNFHKSKALKYTKHSVKVFFFMLSFFTYGFFDNFKKKTLHDSICAIKYLASC